MRKVDAGRGVGRGTGWEGGDIKDVKILVHEGTTSMYIHAYEDTARVHWAESHVD